jgi:hypothetical protein
MGLCRKPDFVHLFVDLKIYEGDLLSPPEGEAACGVHPLDPLCNLVNLMRGNRNVGGCPGGGGGGETKSSQELYDLIFLSISTEPKIVNILSVRYANGLSL